MNVSRHHINCDINTGMVYLLTTVMSRHQNLGEGI